MSQDPYSSRVRALFADPAHAGSLDAAPRACISEQGLRVEFAAISRAGRLERLRFRACGCPHVIAAAESVCAELEGQPLAALDAYTTAGLMQSLPVPVEKRGRILVVEDAVRALGAAIRDTSAITS